MRRDADHSQVIVDLGSCFRSTLNRFASADTIVPDPANPQSFNRYSYVLNSPVNFTDPTGHFCVNRNSGGQLCSEDPDHTVVLRNSPTTSSSLPSTAPSGLSDRPYGTFGDQGPGGLQAYNAFTTLQDVGGWWGETIEPEEALMMLINHEFGNLYGGDLSVPNELPPKVLELITRRYNAYCSGGAWSAQCFNSFWAYSEPITNVVSSDLSVSQDAISILQSHERYTTHAAQLANTANAVINNPNLGGEIGNRPFHWATVNSSSISWSYWLGVTNAGDPNDILTYWYYWPEEANLFLVFTSDQNPGTIR